ncbi:uncharacterized protein LOC142644344 [Castanea sativa]|uniref:uncharacterized protein LOC142644344 n=1 Tax=Castanea sativa TaxID=21020 RepID=UPI003F650784
MESYSGSYAWKSILSARDVIRKGMVWRIGDGQSVRIKEDKWLPVKPSRLTLSPLPSFVVEAKVSFLINPDLSMWKSEEVNQLFLPYKASLVLAIPLSHKKPPDRVSWSCTPSREFNASSAYKLLAASASIDRVRSSNQVPDELRTEMFATITWCLWNRQNALHFGRPAQPLSNISVVVGALLQEFIASQISENPCPQPSARHQWHPPKPGFVKANFDAALFNHSNSARLGVIVRDWRGISLGALSTHTPLTSSVADMETLACLRSVQFAAELELQRVIVEVKFSYINRTSNLVVDTLAKKALSIVGCHVWMDALPLDIAALVDFDVH